MVEQVNGLMQKLKHKPDHLKNLFQLSAGGILNAYREGDINFDEAVGYLELWKKR